MGNRKPDGEIGLFDAVAIEVGLIVGAGVFTVTGIATGVAGTAVFLSYVAAMGVVVLGLVPTVVLASAYPVVGGNYRYPSRLWSPRVAFLSAWGLAVSLLGGGLPLYALSFGQYLDSLVAVHPRIAGGVALTAFFLLNLVGIEPAARVQTAMLVSLVASLLVFVVFGLGDLDPGNLRPLFPTGVSGALTGAALLYFVCLGANFVVDLGGEIRAAAVTIPRSFAVSVPLVLGTYVLTSLVAVGTVGWEVVANEPLSVAAAAFLSPELEAVFVVGGALFAIATTMNAVLMIAPKYLFVLAEDGLFPAWIAAVNDRFGTVHYGLALLYVVSIAFLASPIPLEGLGTLMAFGSIFLVVPVMVAAIRLVRDHPGACEDAPLGDRPRLVAASAGAAVVLNLVLMGLLAAESTRVFALWAVATASGAVVYRLRGGVEGVPDADRLAAESEAAVGAEPAEEPDAVGTPEGAE